MTRRALVRAETRRRGEEGWFARRRRGRRAVRPRAAPSIRPARDKRAAGAAGETPPRLRASARTNLLFLRVLAASRANQIAAHFSSNQSRSVPPIPARESPPPAHGAFLFTRRRGDAEKKVGSRGGAEDAERSGRAQRPLFARQEIRGPLARQARHLRVSAPLREPTFFLFASSRLRAKNQIAAHFSSNQSRSAPSNSGARTSATRV